VKERGEGLETYSRQTKYGTKTEISEGGLVTEIIRTLVKLSLKN